MTEIMVIGAGVMGQGIAQTALVKGIAVHLHDVNAGALQRGMQGIADSLKTLARKGKIEQTEADACMQRLHAAATPADAGHCRFVIEAAVEQIDVKKKIFAGLDECMEKECILASNTSGLSITAMAAVTGRPDKVIGLHFFNPVPVMPLVEIIKGSFTSETTYEASLALCSHLGKTAVTVNEAPGFVVNRLLVPMINEAVFILSEGVAGAEDIDKAMCLGANHKIGPLALADLIGLDVCLAIMEQLHRNLGEDKYRPAPLLRKMVQAGRLGRKSGGGFFPVFSPG